MQVPFSFLAEQFRDPSPVLESIRELVKKGDFTLGKALERFEATFASYCGASHAVGVGSGTDALFLSLVAAGVRPGDEVITSANTFVATAGAIVQAGARPVFVDVDDDLNIDPSSIENAITQRTTALIPVHWAGRPADLAKVALIARKHGLILIEDACQALGGKIEGQSVGTFGIAGAFSLHPIKPLHVWGDGGVIVTQSSELAQKLRLLRNHGLDGRDVVRCFAYNSRMDSLQAVVGNCLFESLETTIHRRIDRALRYYEALGRDALADKVQFPAERKTDRNVFHLFQLRVKNRDLLLRHLHENGIEAKVHYPIPLHLQPAASYLGYRKGDFPRAEELSEGSITLPCHQYLSDEQLEYVAEQIFRFYL